MFTLSNLINGFSKQQVLERVGDAMKSMYTTIKFPPVWKPALYMFLSLALSFSTHEGHFYWYTDPEAGPGFSQVLLYLVLFRINAIFPPKKIRCDLFFSIGCRNL